MNPTYNLTLWQRIGLPLLWVMWITSDPAERKSWHEVKKGMEPHEHRFTIKSKHRGLMKCNHEGCNLHHDTRWD